MQRRITFHLLALAVVLASLQVARPQGEADGQPGIADVGPAERSTRDVRLVIIEAAERYGVSAPHLLRVVNCESKFDPWAVGDGGSSFGLAQLNSLRTGLLWHFFEEGYRNPFDPHQAADYMARAFAGEWRHLEIGPWRWTCWEVVRG